MSKKKTKITPVDTVSIPSPEKVVPDAIATPVKENAVEEVATPVEEVVTPVEEVKPTEGFQLLESSFKALITASSYGNDFKAVASIKYSFMLALSKNLGKRVTEEDLLALIEQYKISMTLPAIQSACLQWDDEEARKAFCAFTLCINGIKGKKHLLANQFTGQYEALGAFCAKKL